jgi:DMSO/TMAO reductase YedYZ molybdopterin-dependent catalytic subunit
MSDGNPPVIISPDTRRGQRIPPHQAQTRKWPVLHAGPTPAFDRAAWTFHVFGLVAQPWQCNYDEFLTLPRVQVQADMHCVTRWSKLDNVWEGVSTRTVLDKVKVLPQARFVMVHCDYWTTSLPYDPNRPGRGWFTTNLPLADFLAEDCLFAWKHNGVELEPDHGYPLRLVVPRLYAWKSAKWVRAVELMAEDKAGFWEEWENGGYHMRGDPWAEERFRPRQT